MQVLPATHLDALALCVAALPLLVRGGVSAWVFEFERGTMPSRMASPRLGGYRGWLTVEYPVLGKAHQHLTVDFGGLGAEGCAAIVAIPQEQESTLQKGTGLTQLLEHDLGLSARTLDTPVVEDIDPTALLLW